MPHDVKLLRVLTDRGSEQCGNPERCSTITRIGRYWSIEGAAKPLVELAVEVAPRGAGKHPAAADNTGRHSANICGRMGRGDSLAGRPRRRSARMQQEAAQ
jgi:hypothetical protein